MLAPIAPASAGNGLAMRCELFRRSAARDFELQIVVVPVAGQLPDGVSPSQPVEFAIPDETQAKAGILELLTDSRWRDRLSRAGKLPAFARYASPGLAGAVSEVLDLDPPPAGVHVMRSYLAPLGLAVAERIGAGWATIDLDDDDAGFCTAVGLVEEAEAYTRAVSVFGPEFAGLSAASANEAAAIGRRHNLQVRLIPNAVEVPGDRPAPRPRKDELSVLFVGNLNYRPNVDAARFLVRGILPEILRRFGGRVSLTIAGSSSHGLEELQGAHVTVAGYVPDLAALYAAADAVVVPLRFGSGTRIKLLEAFAQGAPVIATSVAAAGLDAVDGRHLLIAEDPMTFADALERLAAEPGLRGRLVREARELVMDRYSLKAVGAQIQEFFSAVSGR